jgi:tetratricopeptide (TPR) repeat protein
MKKSVVLSWCFWTATTLGLRAQANEDVIVQAFSEAYAMEAVGNYPQAIASLKKVYDPKSYELNVHLGWVHHLTGNHNESIKYYQKCLDLRPLSIEARMALVEPAAELGNWDQVLAQYAKILEIDPQHSVANYRSGLIYYNRADYKTAERFFEKVINLYPFDYHALLYQGWTKYFLGKTSEAKTLFLHVRMYSPDDASAKEGLSLIK